MRNTPKSGVRSAKLILIICAMAGSAALGQATRPTGSPTGFTDGQKVEAREGDSWSAATVVKREGRKYLIHYEGADASADEWVMADRIRVPGSGGSEPAGPVEKTPSTQPGKPAVKAPAKAQWNVGQAVSVKWGGLWREAKIIQKRGEWSKVEYGRSESLEWVEPWRIRSLNSKEDNIPYARPNGFADQNSNPPTPTPGPIPEDDFPRHRGGGAATNNGGEEKDAAPDPLLKPVDVSAAPVLDLVAPLDWQAKPDPYLGAKTPAVRTATKGAIDDFWDAPRDIVITRGVRPCAFVLHSQESPGKSASTRVEKIELGGGGSSVGVYAVSPKTRLLAASPDGKTFATADQDPFGKKQGRVEIYSVEGATAKRTAAFDPSATKTNHRQSTDQGAFVDDTHLVLSSDGQVTLFALPELKPAWTAKSSQGSVRRFALSPGGKQLALAWEESVVIVDSLTGKALASIPATGVRFGYMSFSPSGEQLAVAAGSTFSLFDVATGKQLRGFTTPHVGSELAMTTNGYALTGGGNLIDFERRIVLWSYTGATEPTVSASGRCYYAMKKPAALVSADLPDAAAAALAKTLKAEDLLLLKPDTKVGISVNIEADDAQRQQVIESIKQKLARNGLVADDGAPIKLVLSTSAGKPEEIFFKPWADPFGVAQKATMTPHISEIYLEFEGKRAWSTRTESRTSSLTLKEGQSVQDALNEATKPNIGFFKGVEIPTYVTRPHEPAWYGTSPMPGSK